MSHAYTRQYCLFVLKQWAMVGYLFIHYNILLNSQYKSAALFHVTVHWTKDLRPNWERKQVAHFDWTGASSDYVIFVDSQAEAANCFLSEFGLRVTLYIPYYWFNKFMTIKLIINLLLGKNLYRIILVQLIQRSLEATNKASFEVYQYWRYQRHEY